MSVLIRKDDAVKCQIYSRDLREYVVPVRLLNKLVTFDEPEEQPENYKDALRFMFNRCYVLSEGMVCWMCGHRNLCDSLRSVGKGGEI